MSDDVEWTVQWTGPNGEINHKEFKFVDVEDSFYMSQYYTIRELREGDTIPEDFPLSDNKCKFCGCQMTTKNFAYFHVGFGYACTNCRDLGVFDTDELSLQMQASDVC